MAQGNMSSGNVNDDKFSVAYIIVPSTDAGKNVGNDLVKRKLAVSFNMMPQIKSIYEWKNELNQDTEILLMVKTQTAHVHKLTEYVRTNHPYEVCEVISLPIKNSTRPYFQWVTENVYPYKYSGNKN